MVGNNSKKRTREQTTKGNSGISPANKRAGTAKTGEGEAAPYKLQYQNGY